MFDFAVSLAASLAHAGIKKAFAKTVNKELNKAINTWHDALPEALKPQRHALFPLTGENGNPLPAFTPISQAFSQDRAPEPQLWTQLLLERWQYVIDLGRDGQSPFFREDNKAEVTALFQDLGQALWRACHKEPTLFQTSLAQTAEATLRKVEQLTPMSRQEGGSRFAFGVNPDFVERPDDMAKIVECFTKGNKVVITSRGRQSNPVMAAIGGLGGIGKTQLANHFAHKYANDFKGGVYWVSFAQPQAIATEIMECGMTMGVVPPSMALDNAVRATVQAWETGEPCLLIFDNCEDEALIPRWSPKTGNCRILITSRRQQWQNRSVTVHRLDVFTPKQGVTLLASLCPRLKDDPHLVQIHQALGGLPLALHLAGCYLNAYPSISPTTYLELLAEGINHESLQGRGTQYSPTAHDLSLKRTFDLSIGQLQPNGTDLLASDLLARSARFQPGEPIPDPLLRGTVTAEPRDLDDGLRRLVNLGLLELAEEGYKLHRLIADYVTSAFSDQSAVAEVENAVLQEAWRQYNTGDPRHIALWAGHLKWVTDHADQNNQRAGGLHSVFGSWLDTMGDPQAALPYYQQALEIRKRVLGEDHPDTATSLNNMGYLLQAMGDLQAAKPYFQQALEIYKRVLGEDHPHTAGSLNNMGYLLQAMGDLQAAKPYYQQALEISKRVLGEDHPDTASSLNNMGYLLQAMGDLQAAKPYYQQALEIRKRVLGEDHPDTAQSLNNMGALLRAMGDLQAAKPYYQQALEIRKRVLGEDHPDTAGSLNNMGALLQAMGDLQVAKPFYQQALAIRKRILGEDHPDTASSLNNMGYLLDAMGDQQAAKLYYQQAVEIVVKKLGERHPTTVLYRNNLEILKQKIAEKQVD